MYTDNSLAKGSDLTFMKKRRFNYIRIKDEQPKKRSKKNEKVWRNIGHAMTVVGTTISSMLLILVVMLCIIATVVVVYILDFKKSNSFDIDLNESMTKFTTIMYAYNSDNEEVELKRLVADQDRIWVDYQDISPNIIHAVVAKEDKRFYEHKGVDWQRTVFALINDIIGSEGTARQGGSTITQQLVKNVTKDDEQTWERKLREIFRALSLEERYTKENILEYYLNEIGFGGRIYGVEAACQSYFGKSASEVDIAEAAIIAGIIKNPGRYPPTANLSLCRDQQLVALYALYEQGYISLTEYEAAKQEQVKFKPVVYGDAFGYVDPRSVATEEPDETEAPEETDSQYEAYKWNEGTYEVTQNWYTDAAINQVINDYADLKGITYTSARNEIYSGGYKIYTNMDMEKQDILEEKYRDPKLLWGNTKYDKTTPSEELYQSAFVLMDYTGTVKAVVGGLGEKPGDGCFNRATQAVRAPGSTMKPISPYAVGIQNNVITYATLIPDKGIPVNFQADPWPNNFEGGQSGNLWRCWEAVRHSRNTIPIRISSLITPQVLYNHLIMNLGFTTLVEEDNNLAPITLGALSQGVHLTELTAAYQIFGNGGVYYEPKLYSRVYDSKGNVVLKQDFYGTQAVDSDSAWVLNRMLRTVITSPTNNNLGPYARLGNNVEVIGKTGTSNDEKNFLFVGETPNYVGVIWIGKDNGDPVKWASGIRYHSQVWHDVMMSIEDTEKVSRFMPDPTVVERSYCTETGLLATSACSSTDIGYYRPSNIPGYCSGDHEAEQQKIRDYWNAFDNELKSKFKD